MILTGPEILQRIERGEIRISPFDPAAVNPNSVNLRLDNWLTVYIPGPRPLWRRLLDWLMGRKTTLDMARDNPTQTIELTPDGYELQPGVLYLASTIEHTATYGSLVPFIEGRSSIGRLGIQTHVTAGVGDTHFQGKWTLELTAVHPVRIYPGVAICQILYFEARGEVRPYVGRYQNQAGALASRLWHDFQ